MTPPGRVRLQDHGRPLRGPAHPLPGLPGHDQLRLHRAQQLQGKEERIGQLFILRGKEQEPVRGCGPGDIGAVAKLQHTSTGDTLWRRARQVDLRRSRSRDPSSLLAAQPRSKGDEDKISTGAGPPGRGRPHASPSSATRRRGEMMVSGLGEMHVEVIVARLKRKFGVDGRAR